MSTVAWCAADVRRGVAVETQNGKQIHWPDFVRKQASRTLCGREWVDLHSSNVSISAVTCAVCLRRYDELCGIPMPGLS